ncbi:amylo-alpha-1,6-glucosidase [Nocardia panacis]|uniref:amylo-alpha-1,6-glucosidase n=1 Tax=Nocardia panacis TaxID=2340916 RepID=UPI001EF047D3|nr:glycogen debranching N-terminal domain-containing protein [Nocardia panacis]
MTTPWTSAPESGGAEITLVEGSTFCLSGPGGEVAADRPQGLFVRDTRVLSHWRLTIDGAAPQPLTVESGEPYSATMLGRRAPQPGQADSPVLVVLARHVGDGMREDLTVRNLSAHGIDCRIALELGSDFADLFEVKEGRRSEQPPPSIETEDGALRFVHQGTGLGMSVHATGASAAGQALHWDAHIPAHEEWTTCLEYRPALGDAPLAPRYPCGTSVQTSAPAVRLREWQASAPRVETGSELLARVLRRTLADLGTLRIFDPRHRDRAVVAAGAPWFMTLFGRDSLLTSWMVLPLDRQLALGTLQTLADLQGSAENEATEEQPGRIPHEVRFGRAATKLLGGDTVYYGTADATPLFVMLLGELARWGIDPAVRAELLPHADRALAWITEYGDADGDGFVEYSRFAEHGLANQGWKDSWDGINRADGAMPEPPIALAEVQGYVYAAYLARAELADAAGENGVAGKLRLRASALKTAFNDAFWLPERGWYAVGLDRDKRPIDALTSNIGHCLWTGIIDEDRAERVADLLLSPTMFSGWGIRTLAADMGAYNPVSYHNGSVWPHDNAICAAGLTRYGFRDHAATVIDGMLDAAARFGYRLPELFCGFDRDEFRAPVPYPTSCSPQAWAAAAPLLFVRSLLRLEPGDGGVPSFEPAVPARYLPLQVCGVRIRSDVLTVSVDKDGWQMRGATGT